MIQDFVDRFMAARDQIRSEFTQAHPGDYKDIVRVVVNHHALKDRAWVNIQAMNFNASPN